MKRYDTDKLNQVLISEVASILNIEIPKNKKMNCFKGHDSKSPSLHFYLRTNTFYCFGCGIGSKNIDLVMEYCGISFKDACEILENHFFSDISYKIPTRKIEYKKNTIDFTLDEEIYKSILDNAKLSSRGEEYLKTRGFTLETIHKYKIFDIEEPYVFFEKLREIWGDERLYKCGLLKIKDGKYISSWWRYTIVFPYFNLDNKVIYLQGRYIDHENLRWVNLPNVKSSLYNMNILNNCRRGDKIYIAEGITDTLTLNQEGYKAVGVMGANNFKKEYIFLLMDYEVWVVPDNDNGGDKFFNDVLEKFAKYKSVRRLTFDNKFKDITDYYKGITNE